MEGSSGLTFSCYTLGEEGGGGMAGIPIVRMEYYTYDIPPYSTSRYSSTVPVAAPTVLSYAQYRLK